MYIDSKIFKIIGDNIGLEEEETNLLIDDHRSSLLDLIIVNIFNEYAKNSSIEDRTKLEETMSRVAKEGKAEDQKFILGIIKTTIIKYPELSKKIRKQQNEIHAKLIFEFLEKADSEAQVELLTYLLHQQKLAKKVEEKLKELE